MVKANFRKKTQISQAKRGTKKGEAGDNSASLRLAATILDECETEGQREEYIKALQKHASVHIYGRCGAPCPGWVTEDCLKYLDKHYKVCTTCNMYTPNSVSYTHLTLPTIYSV